MGKEILGSLELNRIYQFDCIEGMKLLPDNCIDFTITSPPYDDLRKYNGYSFDFENVAKQLFRIMKEGGIVVWIVKDSVYKGSETLTSFKQALFFKEIGFNIHDTMIYQKNAMPFPEQTRYIQCFEYMFVLSKGKPNTTNLLKEKTKGYKPSKSSTQRNKDGSVSQLKYEQGKEFRSKWNVWLYDVGYNKTTKDKFAFDHPAMFPEDLAKDHILSWSNENDVVFDPFMGAGTTAKMAQLNNRKYLGFEISKEYIEIANKRLESLEDWSD